MHRAHRIGTHLILAGLVLASEGPSASAASNCASQPDSNVGCEFYAVALPNLLVDQTTFHFGVAFLNPAATAVNATVDGGGLSSPDNFSIPAGSSITRTLPWVPGTSLSSSTVKVVGGAYHISVTGPATALQLNAVEPQIGSARSSSNDASLLIPVQSAGKSYRIVAWPTWAADTQLPGYAAVVATAASTTVQVTAPGVIQPGAGLNANGGTVNLDRGDVLLISSALNAAPSAYGADLSGTLITSTRPVLVWTGHAGSNINAGTAFADHLEETLPPTSAWGDDYFIVRPGDASGLGTGSRMFVKVVGMSNGTTLSTNPLIGGVPSNLDAGQTAVFETTVDFRLQGSNPLGVGLFMEGSQAAGFTGGDPSQSIPVATDRGKRSVDFIAPTNLAPVWAQLVAPTGAAISVDSVPATGWTAIGSSGYSVTRVPLCCTQKHHASGDLPFTISIHAYPGDDTSYWYPGSLGIEDGIFRDGFE